MKVSIITVCYNSDRFLKRYLQSIICQKVKKLEIILIDSKSNKKSLTITKEIIKSFKKKLKIKLIESDFNIGYAGGNNLGSKIAEGEYLFFLGPDTYLDNNCLKDFLKTAKQTRRKNFILVGRQKRYERGEYLFDGICTDIFQFPFKLYNDDNSLATKRMFYCDGAAIFIPHKTFNKIGRFDEALFMFADDVDLSWKAHLFKIPLLNVPQAVIYHFSGGSLKGGIIKGPKYATTYLRRYLGERNTIRNFIKNYSLFTLVWLLPIYLLINLVEIIIFFIFNRRKVSYQYLAAWWWNILCFRSTLKKRSWVQSRRKVNDWEIFKKLYFGSGKLNAFLKIKIPTFE